MIWIEWRFPEIEVPPNHPFQYDVPLQTIHFRGTSIYGNPYGPIDVSRQVLNTGENRGFPLASAVASAVASFASRVENAQAWWSENLKGKPPVSMDSGRVHSHWGTPSETLHFQRSVSLKETIHYWVMTPFQETARNSVPIKIAILMGYTVFSGTKENLSNGTTTKPTDFGHREDCHTFALGCGCGCPSRWSFMCFPADTMCCFQATAWGLRMKNWWTENEIVADMSYSAGFIDMWLHKSYLCLVGSMCWVFCWCFAFRLWPLFLLMQKMFGFSYA